MMISKARAFAVASLLAATSFAAQSALAEAVGFVATAKGDVQIQKYGETSWAAATMDRDVEVGDTIKTGYDSQAKIILIDDTVLNVDEDTEFRIDSLHVGAAATRDRSIIRQTRGRLRTVVGSAFGGETKLEIHTPTAVVGVKGTDVETAQDDDQQGKERWLFCLHDGKIFVRNAQGLQEPKPGNCVYAYGNQPPTEPFLNVQVPLAVASTGPAYSPPDFVEVQEVGSDGGDDGSFDGGIDGGDGDDTTDGVTSVLEDDGDSTTTTDTDGLGDTGDMMDDGMMDDGGDTSGDTAGDDGPGDFPDTPGCTSCPL